MRPIRYRFAGGRLLGHATLVQAAALIASALTPLLAAEAYVPEGPTQSRPASHYANSVDEAETVLPPVTPGYFAAVYPHLLKSPLPARIYNQGGIPQIIPGLQITGNPYGRLATYLPAGPVYTARHAFFRSLGTNGRSCATCHQPPSGMSFSLRNVRARFRATAGTDPIFAPSTAPTAPTRCRRSTPPAPLMAVARARAGRRSRTHTRCSSPAG